MKFIDLDAQRARLEPIISKRIQDVVASGAYIFGPPVEELEGALSEFANVPHTVTCANGTDALHLILRAWGIGPGDLVAVPAFSFAATAEAPVLAGAGPLFVDVDPETFNLDPDRLKEAITAEQGGRRLKAVIAVDLFGQPANYSEIAEICRAHGLKLLADVAQSFGATRDGRASVAFGDAAATSFYPAKPLGCYGDGGAMFTADDVLAERLRSLRNHGEGATRYDHLRVGLNSRLDSIQAAVLLEKLRIFPDEIDARQKAAKRYDVGLGGLVKTPVIEPGCRSVWAQYTVRTASRDALQAKLKENGVPSVIYYPIPLHRQPAFEAAPTGPGGCPVSEQLANEVLSLPMHPYLAPEAQDTIIAAVKSGLNTAAMESA